ncbi:MAG: hypothetical protein HQ518_21140 [Rhodopirellula sp.]|nr:hypothetical protein [Rhodopirellula sp.]
MHLKHAYRSLAAGVGLFFLTGCYAPYGGYPPGAYAPQGGAPMQYQGVPQSSYVMPGDALGSPSSIGSQAPSTFAPGSNLQAPDPTARGASGGSPSPVPLPRDPDPAAQKPTPAGQQTSQFGIPTGPPAVSLGEPAELDFQSPIVVAGADNQSAGSVVTASGQSASGNSLGHDPNYNWFQGRLEYVESDQAWHLTYDDTPMASDQLGGDISLSKDVKLEPQHNGMLVRASGQFDDTKLDRLGKPVFRVSRIDPVDAR